MREHDLSHAFRVLRSVNIEPILLKGWSVGRLYKDPATRPLGDIDLLVRDEQSSKAEKSLHQHRAIHIDWHRLSDLRAEFAKPDEIFERSELVSLLDTEIRVLCPEDNLHFVAIHMLRHGGWSPMWLRDLSVMLTCRRTHFDWSVCVGTDATRAGWVLSGLVLAHRLAGADISGTPAETFRIPEWLERTARRAQETPDAADNQPPESVWTALAHPWRIPLGLRKRWPNPITAAVRIGASFERRSPLSHQLRYCASLTRGFLSRAL